MSAPSGRLRATAVAIAVGATAAASATPSSATLPTQATSTPTPDTAALHNPITVTFVDTPIRDVLLTFAEFADRSIVPGPEVQGPVSAEIRGQRWDVALRALLDAHGYVWRDRDDDVIVVEGAGRLASREALTPLETRAIRATYVDSPELQEMILPLLTDRGRLSAGPTTNVVVVTDVPRVLRDIEALVAQVDLPVRQVDIAAEIVFVNRTRLNGLGITYDLKDTQGNQLNVLTPGVADLDGDGIISLPDEQVPIGTDVVTLGGNSLAALGNAADRIPAPTLSLLASLVMGKRSLVTFIDALESAQLTEVEASPTVRGMAGRTARIMVGEETPVRVLDAGAQVQAGEGSNGGRGFPVATVDYKETGVILEVQPRVTDHGEVLLTLSAERSSADVAPSDIGYVFRRQKAESEVLARDGETVVIGGLTVAEAGEVRSGIPWLMDLPVVGRLFRSRREVLTHRDLLILVTPSIVPMTPP